MVEGAWVGTFARTNGAGSIWRPSWAGSSNAYLATSEPPQWPIGANVVTGIAADDPDGGWWSRRGAGRQFAAIGTLRNETLVHVIQMPRAETWAMSVSVAMWAGSQRPIPDGGPAPLP